MMDDETEDDMNMIIMSVIVTELILWVFYLL